MQGTTANNTNNYYSLRFESGVTVTYGYFHGSDKAYFPIEDPRLGRSFYEKRFFQLSYAVPRDYNETVNMHDQRLWFRSLLDITDMDWITNMPMFYDAHPDYVGFIKEKFTNHLNLNDAGSVINQKIYERATSISKDTSLPMAFREDFGKVAELAKTKL